MNRNVPIGLSEPEWTTMDRIAMLMWLGSNDKCHNLSFRFYIYFLKDENITKLDNDPVYDSMINPKSHSYIFSLPSHEGSNLLFGRELRSWWPNKANTVKVKFYNKLQCLIPKAIIFMWVSSNGIMGRII